MFITFMDDMIEITPAFIHYLTESFNQIFVQELEPTPDHVCSPRAFITEEDEKHYRE